MRERLGDLYDPSGQQSHCFTAQFHCFGKTDEGSNVALLVAVEHNGRYACDHAWIHKSKAMKQLELQRGDIVEFQAVVSKYPRQGESFSRAEDAQWDYCFKKIREMIVIQRRK